MNSKIIESDLQSSVEFFEYTSAANPDISQVPYAEFLRELHEQGPSRVIPFDLSAQLNCEGPASSPNLAAAFVRLLPGEKLKSVVNASSELYYVIRGKGVSIRKSQRIEWKTGDFFVVPGGSEIVHEASDDSALYWVTDQPVFTYLGAKVSEEKFQPTLYSAEECREQLAKVAADPASANRNRVSVLLGNKNFPQTKTITHTLWAMFGLLPKGMVQPAHRHNSVALDFILDCKPGCYTLVSRTIDSAGNLIKPIRQDWKPYSAFITPPFYWHSHHNESGEDAHLIPIQDAGLQTYMRTLNIEFAHPSGRSGNSGD